MAPGQSPAYPRPRLLAGLRRDAWSGGGGHRRAVRAALLQDQGDAGERVWRGHRDADCVARPKLAQERRRRAPQVEMATKSKAKPAKATGKSQKTKAKGGSRDAARAAKTKRRDPDSPLSPV